MGKPEMSEDSVDPTDVEAGALATNRSLVMPDTPSPRGKRGKKGKKAEDMTKAEAAVKI